jgi:rod shape-determining protein MreB
MDLQRFISGISCDFALDLGTFNTLIYQRGKGIVANEASYVAIDRRYKGGERVTAVGNRAKALRGKTSRNIQCELPFRSGAIQDLSLAKLLLKRFFDNIPQPGKMLKSTMIASLPPNATEPDKYSVIAAAEHAGAGRVFIVDELIAAAIGAGIPIEESRGTMIVDLGGGSTDAAVISANGIVCSHSITTGGNTFDQRISEYVRKQRHILIGEETAEEAKIKIGAARAQKNKASVQLQGHDLARGRPTMFTLDQEEVVNAITEPLKEIAELLRRVLDRTPPEVASDLIDTGIVLVGGGALLPDIDTYLSEATGIHISLAEEPITAIIEGTGTILEEWEKYKHLLAEH